MKGYDILRLAVKALDDKKGTDLAVIKTDEVTVIADYFVLVTATSGPHIRALSEAVEEALSLNGLEPNHIEGRTTGWILLDYGDVIINVMDAKNRDFYGLEHTWNDGERLDIETLLK